MDMMETIELEDLKAQARQQTASAHTHIATCMVCYMFLLFLLRQSIHQLRQIPDNTYMVKGFKLPE